MTISKYWLNQDKYKLQDAAYLVCGLEPQLYPADYEQSGAPIMVVRAYAQMQSYAPNRSYLWEQYSLSRDELCSYAWEFGGADVAEALGFHQNIKEYQEPQQNNLIQNTCTDQKRSKKLIIKDDRVRGLIEDNPDLRTITPKDAKAFIIKNAPDLFNKSNYPHWYRANSLLEKGVSGRPPNK